MARALVGTAVSKAASAAVDEASLLLGVQKEIWYVYGLPPAPRAIPTYASPPTLPLLAAAAATPSWEEEAGLYSISLMKIH